MSREDNEYRKEAPGRGDPTRILALNDGVCAIIMTLLVLELKVPNMPGGEGLAHELMGRTPELVAYVISFLLAGVYWAGHRDLFNLIRRVTPWMVWQNIIFLMIISLIPFNASLLGKYPDSPLTLTLYGVFLVVAAGWRSYMFFHATRRPELLFQPVSRERCRRVMWIMVTAISTYIIACPFAFIAPGVSLLVYGVTPPLFVLASTHAFGSVWRGEAQGV